MRNNSNEHSYGFRPNKCAQQAILTALDMMNDEDSIVGTPQGGNLSPLLANIMLNELDKEMEQRGLNFVRYEDDCIIMVGSEMSAKRVMRNLSRFIEEKLGLKVNITKSKLDKPQGLKYLGFGFYFDKSSTSVQGETPLNVSIEIQEKNERIDMQKLGSK